MKIHKYIRQFTRQARSRKLDWRLGLSCLLVLAILSPFVWWLAVHISHERRYNLSVDDRSLIAQTDYDLASRFTYSSKDRSYTFNTAAFNASDSTNSVQVGGGAKAKEPLYGVKLPAASSKGLTVADKTSGLSFSLTPLFNTQTGKAVGQNGKAQAATSKNLGHILYPLNGLNATSVYTIEGNGVKEDMILNSAPAGGEVSFGYRLELPDTLSARLDANGNLGIYSADPALFGNISYGDSQDQQAVMDARQHGPKNHLVFVLPAPVVYESGSQAADPAGSQARFSLDGDVLTVTASGLTNLHYPATIDPSVVDSAANGLLLGNNDGDATFDSTNNWISESGLTGGSLSGSWSTNTNPLSQTLMLATSVAYNGYVYELGGNNGTADQPSVYYAPFCTAASTPAGCPASNWQGAIGSWNPTAALPVATDEATSAVYDGYIYEIGGNQSGTTTAAVYYAKIDTTNGQLDINGPCSSVWCSTTALTQARELATSVAYNGYVYELGGDNGGANQWTIYYAPIKTDGSLGSWATNGSDLPAAINQATSAVYNGYIYELGGWNGSAMLSTVYYASINSDGSIGSWFYNYNALPATVDDSTSVVYNGYLYTIGGNGTSAVYYAAINADGSTQPWQSTTALLGGINYATSIAYKGYVYLLGGLNGSIQSAIYYQKIDAAGINGSLSTSTNTFTAERGLATVAYNGYLYEFGGDAGSTPTAVVSYSQIGSAGAPGSWSTTTAFTKATARTFLSAVAYNGYMYVIGGCKSALSSCTTASNDIATIYYSAINPTNGTLGTWTATTSLPTALYGFSAVTYDGYLYIMGGVNGSTFKNTVQHVAINTSGTLGTTWTTDSSNSLNSARAYFGATVYGGYAYYAGGCQAGSFTACTTADNDIYYAPLSSSGGFSAGWTSTNTFTNAREGLSLTANNGYLYITAGLDSSGNYYGDVQYGAINTGGSVAGWSSGPAWSPAVAAGGTVIYNGYIYVTGGYNGSTYYGTVLYAQINNGGSGTTSGWFAGNSLPQALNGGTSVAYNGRVYYLGGHTVTSGNPDTTNVYYATISPGVGIGTWNTTSNLPETLDASSTVIWNGYMYEIAGEDSSLSEQSQPSVYYAKINSDGTLGAWGSTTSLPTGIDSANAVTYNGYVYEIGGEDDTATPQTSVYYAKFNGDGTLGTWNTTASLPVAIFIGSAVEYNGYIYQVGGWDGTNGLTTPAVYYAKINSDGTLGAWGSTTSMDSGRMWNMAVAYNGYLYELGGDDPSTTMTSTVYYAPINANGTLGTWQSTSALATTLATSGTVVYNGSICVIGGNNGGYTAAVDCASAYSIPRIATYSQVVNLTGTGSSSSLANDPVPTGVALQGSNIGNQGAGGGPGVGGVQVFENIAGSTCSTFGSQTMFIAPGSYNNATVLSPASDGCGDGLNGHYVRIRLNLDDSQTATFPDSSSSHTNVSAFRVFYRPGSGARLRGGATFTGGSLQTLATPP